MTYDPMNGGMPGNPMTVEEQFWIHERHCDTCNQHPQSVASFHYETMCSIGRNYAVAMGMFKSYGPPDISGPAIFVQDAKPYEEEHLKAIEKINNE